ncbi:MAG TPA: asparagine synthase-related protein, partial [Acidobacteriota bacterium]
ILKGKKRGFAANVVDQWFRSSLNGALRNVLLDESSLMFGLLNPRPVRRLLEGHQSGRQDNHKLLFSLVMLEQWLRRSWSQRELISAVQERVDAVRLAS